MDLIQRRLMILAGQFHELSSRPYTAETLHEMRAVLDTAQKGVATALTLVSQLDDTPRNVYHQQRR